MRPNLGLTRNWDQRSSGRHKVLKNTPAGLFGTQDTKGRFLSPSLMHYTPLHTKSFHQSFNVFFKGFEVELKQQETVHAIRSESFNFLRKSSKLLFKIHCPSSLLLDSTSSIVCARRVLYTKHYSCPLLQALGETNGKDHRLAVQYWRHEKCRPLN